MSFNDKVVLLSDVLPDCRFRLSCLAAEGKAYMMQDYIWWHTGLYFLIMFTWR